LRRKVRGRRAIRLLGRRAECEALDRLLTNVLAGQSQVTVLRGDAGVGKSALLDYVSGRVEGWHVAETVGVESEMELAYAALHVLSAPMLDHLDRLPPPQRDALATVFGLSGGPAPDQFLVGLATLSLFAEVAERQPLICIVDDAQWLDRASAQILGFVARRLLAERIAIVCAARTGIGDDVLAGLPEVRLHGLDASDARALLLGNLYGPLDAAVCDQIIAESHGNPLALLELPRTWDTADLAGGFGLPESQPIASKIEHSYAKRLVLLPAETQLLVLAAAAEPLGKPLLLQRAGEILGLDMEAADAAVDAGLLKMGARIEFAHPLVRSAAYRGAATDERHRVHRALAQATDPARDPDRRVWHLARAIAGPDEDVAAELEHSASRAQARGGLAAAAAFLERAAELSPHPADRARRTLEAAGAKQLAGAPQAASTLLAAAVDGPLDERESALAQGLKGQIAVDLRRVAEAVPLLLDAADQLASIDPVIARDTYLEALRAANLAGRLGGDMVRTVAEAARSAPTPGASPRAADLFLAGLAARYTDGYAVSAPHLKEALRAFRDEDGRFELDVRWPGFARSVALDMFDDDTCHALCVRSAQLARERGALGVLPLALDYLAAIRCLEGDLAGAAALVEESDVIAAATGAAPFGLGRFPLAGFRGDEVAVSALVEAIEPVAIERGEGALLTKAEYASAVLYNGLGRYETALPVAERASARDGETFSIFSLLELVEAAARSGRTSVAAAATERLSERTQAAGTELALGVEARSRALVSEGRGADELYHEAIDRLGRCRLAPERARAHLLYGEWLRREGRRVDAREQLRTAHQMLTDFGMRAFAERARSELRATGEKVRKRTEDTRDHLTAQERQIGQLARDGLSNPEIAARLFLSPRTVEWHLRKVFGKLGIRSRRELTKALPPSDRELLRA
jgi:DNA-binding CsgD family transcriptional regulator